MEVSAPFFCLAMNDVYGGFVNMAHPVEATKN